MSLSGSVTNPTPALAGEILDFWFGPMPHASCGEWFKKDPAFDAAIGERFGHAIDAAIAGRLSEWRSEAHAALAHILLLDQFTRNAFRDTTRAFAGDCEAQITATALVDRGDDRELDCYERWFVYMPFQHAENPAMQERSVALFTRLARDAGDPSLLEWAEKHAVIVRRFGRFPHRNAILGRASTPEEIAFLREQGSRF